MIAVQREWDWWGYHYRVIQRGQIPGISEWDDELVDLIVAVLQLRPGDRVLDMACGSGDHSLRLAAREIEVLGVDIAPSLVGHCQRRAAEEGIAAARFDVGDMRHVTYDAEFDAAVLLSGSFGFFDDATNLDVLKRLARSLKPGGRVLIDVFDQAQMVVRPPRRSWSAYGGGYGLRTTWWEPETCTYVSDFMFIDTEGLLNTSAEPERIRVYSLPEWRQMFAQVGLIMTHTLADTRLPLIAYDRDHYGNLLIVGRR